MLCAQSARILYIVNTEYSTPEKKLQLSESENTSRSERRVKNSSDRNSDEKE